MYLIRNKHLLSPNKLHKRYSFMKNQMQVKKNLKTHPFQFLLESLAQGCTFVSDIVETKKEQIFK